MRDSSKPLDALTVKRHKEGFLADAAPHRGLRLIANKNGTKVWIYRYKSPEKKLRQIKLGEYPVMGLSDARAEFNVQKSIRNSHGDPREHREEEIAKQKAQAASEKMAGYLVSDMIEDYLEEHIAHHRDSKGQLECRRMLTKDVIPVIGHMPVLDVKRQKIHDLIQSIVPRARRIAGMVKQELRGAFELAITSGRVNEDFVNPTFGVKSPKFTARTRALDDDELIQFFSWLPSSGISKKVKNILMLMLYTGCRGGEVVAIKWKDIDLDRQIWRLPKTKNGRTHTVFYSSQVRAIFEGIESDRFGYMFPSPVTKKHIVQKEIVQNVSRNSDTSGLDHWTAHDLRRTAGTGLAKLGCSRVVQDRILNHVDSSVSAIYDQYRYDSEAKEWWQTWGDHLDGVRLKAEG